MATTYTTILGSDSLSDGRVKINANYLSIESDIEAVQTIADGKMSYSGTVPAIGDMLVAADITWATAKKKVFTASHVLLSDSNWQPTSEAKGTAFNKDFGTWATQIPTGNSVVLLTTDQTVAWVKTFSSSPVVPTLSVNDNTTKAASTAFVVAQVWATKINITTADTTVTGTASETTIYTTTIAANTLGTNNWVEWRIYFTSTNASTTDKVLKLKYGGTTIATVTMTPDANTSLTFKGYIDFMVLWNASTSAQVGSVKINWVIARINTSNTQGIVEMSGAESGTATEDSTGALALTLSIAQNAGETFVAKHAFLKKI